MSRNDFFDVSAELGSEDDDDSYDDETGETKPRKDRNKEGSQGHMSDSSEEEDDDDDEEEAARIREGFIVDEDEEEVEARQRRREKKKRRREEREEEALDEEDLDLIGYRPQPPPTEEKRLKRLKRGHRDDRDRDEPRGLDDIFAEDDDEDEFDIRRRREFAGEFDDFIEEDELPDEERQQMLDELEVQRDPRIGLGVIAGLQSSGLDEAELEDMRAAFGDGTEYDWALELQDAMDDEELDPEKPIVLQDVFEPSLLKDKMLTEEDDQIRHNDAPERQQIARKNFKPLDLTEEEAEQRSREEALWISNMLWPKKRFDTELLVPFQESVAKVLELSNDLEYEVPFIFQHRKDYVIHAVKVPVPPNPDDPDAPLYEIRAEKLLSQNDLWEIVDLDLKFRGLWEKKDTVQKAYEGIKSAAGIHDKVIEDMLPAAVTAEEVQDLQDYLHFQYSAELKDWDATNAEVNGVHKRAGATHTMFERIRSGQAYNVVRGFGITADNFAQSALESGRQGLTDDPQERPDDMADQFIDANEFSTGQQVLKAAKAMFAEEITMSPRMRKLMRQTYYHDGLFDCIRTEKGLRKIDEDHPYYEFKYLRNQNLMAIARRPEIWLRMLKAESEGLIEIKCHLSNEQSFKRILYKSLASDNFSEVADAWNELRREVLDMAFVKLQKIMVKGVKENLKNECENQLARGCRDEFSKRLDQAPWKPNGMALGDIPRVLAVTNGNGGPKDPVTWAWVEEEGKVLETGRFTDFKVGNMEKKVPDGADVNAFVELVLRRKPDVIAISGFSPSTRTLYKDLQTIIERRDLRTSEYEDPDGTEKSDRLEAVLVNDEVARLYHTSDRSTMDYPGLAPLTKYCIALAKYLQSPLKEYAALGRDVTSITLNPNQNLIPQEKLIHQLETAMIDMVNLVGVDLNDACSEPYTSNLLPYVCGLGPRKAQALIQTINKNGGIVSTRAELVGDTEDDKVQALTPKVWFNAASFLILEYDRTEPTSDYLDNTRVHPEDYELGRKMAADTLDLDEEDIKAEVDEGGAAAVVRKLIREEAQENVNLLRLEMYAEQLETNFNQRKRATLETIRAELQQPYEELRRSYTPLNSDDVFTMLTGETRDSLDEGMIVPVVIKRAFPDHIECRLDCGIEGGISASEFPAGVSSEDGIEPRQAFPRDQIVQAKILFLSRKQLSAQLSLREDALRRPYRREIDRMPGEWDHKQEDDDRRALEKRQESSAGRAQRVIKHPLFRNFNAAQAEEYLGPQSRGDVVIRPSSKGLDHLAVTWKVADAVFQHIDVLELDKENEFSVGRTLKIGGRYTYSDLDELIVNHVKAMAKKVDEIMTDERFQSGSKQQTEQWLAAYTEANPRRSMYAFSLNREYPGYFHLCFKAGHTARNAAWPVKIIPNAFELQKNAYPDMRALKNGFKTLFANLQAGGGRVGGGGGGGGGAGAVGAYGQTPRLQQAGMVGSGRAY